MTQQEQKQRYSFDIRAGTDNEDNPITSIDKTVIAYNLDAVIEYCKQEYPIKNMEEVTSDELSVFFEKNYIGKVSDHGNINEITDTENILNADGGILDEYRDEYGEFRDIVDISGGEITQKDYEYMISGNYWNHVVDLTENQ